MPSKKQYNLVSDDAYDSRIPLYNEEAFQHGITFHAKYIGSLDVPRPSSRVEIVAAMRRIRSNHWPWDENKFIIMHHPIYRIFYVSHDSQDLKIFSYIARDGGTNSFKCNVFKSKKKSQAMRIVRTIGQAFEVCHKLSLALASSSACSGGAEDSEESHLHDQSSKAKCQGDGASEPNSCDTQEEINIPKSPDFSTLQHTQHDDGNEIGKEVCNESLKPISLACDSNVQESSSLSVYHHIQLLKEQLEQQNQQMQSVVGQVQLLKDQLSAETTARLEAQAQNHHLLAHNRELLEHIKKLVNHIQEMEQKFHKKEKTDNALPESFLQSSAADLNTPHLHGLKHHLENEKNSLDIISRNTFDEITPVTSHGQFSNSPLPKNISSSFGRQLSVPSTTQHSSSSNPRLGNLPLDSFNPALSLPGSPSPRNFQFNAESIFRADNFVCSSPKQSRKGTNCNQTIDEVLANVLKARSVENNSLQSSPSFSRSSTSPSHYKSRKQNQVFDFDPAAYGSSSLFNYDNYSPKSYTTNDDEDTLNLRQNQESHFQHDSSRCNSSESSVNKDSFIAQVTKDLAKMNTVDRNFSDTMITKKIHMDSGFSSLFKS